MSDIYERVTQRIVTELEKGCAPWVRPWSTINDPEPRNAVSRRPYRGINRLLLGMTQDLREYASSCWLTFRQALALGGFVRKGESATAIVYFEVKTIQDSNEEEKRYPVLRVFHVFNVAQCDGLPADIHVAPAIPTLALDIAAERIMAKSGADFVFGSRDAYYSPDKDRIYLPPSSVFRSAPDFYATTLHELAHWTGHPSRLAREFGRRYGDAAYAMEELVAEMASAYLCAHCRIDGQLQHASYLDSWLKLLANDHRALFTAAAQAQKAADLLLAPVDAALPEELAEAA